MSDQPKEQFTVINFTPKARFMQSQDNISKHRKLVDTREFERGCDFALLEYQRQVTNDARDGNTAAAAALKIRGALEFLHVFRTLSEQPLRASPVIVSDNLQPTS